jgi:CheY-like chemotaxis protein
MKHRVLMVDDEETLIWTTGRQMQRERPDLVFEGFGDPEAALMRVREEAPDVLVTDMRMPKMSGLELLLATREVLPNLPVVVVTAYGTAELRADLQRAGSVEFLEKPFTFASLQAAIDRLLSQPSGFSGAIKLPMLPDLIQLCALARATGSLRISRGADTGAVWFVDGDVVHAECGGARGTAAVFQLLAWQGGTFAMRAGELPPETSIAITWQELLIEGCRLLDESRALGTPATEALLDDAAGPVSTAMQLLAAAQRSVGASADVLVLAVDLRAREVHGLSGVEAMPWLEPIEGALAAVEALTDATPRGAAEWISERVGVAVAWNHERGLAIVLGEELAGSQGASRFRSNLARWRAACRHWLETD